VTLERKPASGNADKYEESIVTMGQTCLLCCLSRQHYWQ